MTAPQIKQIPLPDSDIVAVIHSDIDEYVVPKHDVAVFHKHIIKVWTGICTDDRHLLSDGLEDRQLILRLVGNWGWDDHQQERAIATAWRGCSNKIDFNWLEYQKLSGHVRCCLIAHEIGHLHHGVKGLTRLNMRPTDLPPDYMDIVKLDQGFLRAPALPEIYANSMAKLWGFPPERFQTFMLRNAADCFISDRTARRHALRNLWHHESLAP